MDTHPTISPEPEPRQPPTVARPPVSRKPLWAAAGLLLAAGAAALLWFFTLPYYGLWPGPVEEVSDLIRLEDGPPVYQLNGDVYMLTVSLKEMNAFELAWGWIDPSVDLVPRAWIRPDGVTPDEHREVNLRSMDDSKQTAIVVALGYVGIPVDYSGEGVLVAAVAEGTPAASVLEVGDVIVEVAGDPVSVTEEGTEAILSNQIGDTIPLMVRRSGSLIELEVTLVEHSSMSGKPMVGFAPETYNPSLDLPFEIEIDTQGTGGPSAGVMYALTLIDLLTEEDLVAGKIVAGTGTISADGRVGGIGGVRQKVVAAQNAGARHVLVPESNFEDALTVKRADVNLYAVSTIEEAVEVLQGIPDASPDSAGPVKTEGT